ncbi:MAG: ornithine carbamoyltransferase [Caldiserica bacterium]|nr:ornithine carbamoyltransferase [Caldisericota bacterium]
MDLYGKDLITTQDWRKEWLDEVLALAKDMKKHRYEEPYTEILKYKTFFMFFYNPSVRTRQSFEAAATELGGHAQFLEPKAMRLKSKDKAGETIEDAASIMSRYGVGLGIRILEDAVERYGDGEALLREYAKYASIPIVSMAHDKYHPCQGLADLMGLQEHMGDVKGKKIAMMWGYSSMVRSWSSVQEDILLLPRYGMNFTLAYPEGFDLDPGVVETAKKNAEKAGAEFEITQSALQYKDWRFTSELNNLTNKAYFIHPMPVDRGNEVDDEVASGPRSIIYDIGENRLHAQKAIMALTMARGWK